MIPSSSNSSSFRQTVDHQGSVVWYISFGDLLTLLLCFFLVLTPWSRSPTAQNEQSKQRLSSEQSLASPDGTTFALGRNLKGSVLLSEVPVFERDWLLSIADSKDVPSSMMDDHLRHLRGRISRASLLVCHSRVDRGLVLQRWGEVVHAILGDHVRLEFVVTGSCSSADIRAPVTENVVGRIRLVGT